MHRNSATNSCEGAPPGRAFRYSPRRSVRTALLAVGVLLAACGGDDDDAGGDATASATATPQSPEATAATEQPGSTAAGGANTTEAAGGSDTTPAAGGTEAGADVMSEAEWQAIVDAAVEEGSVVTWGVLQGEHADEIKSAFEAAYPGITLENTRYNSADLVLRVDAEEQAGNSNVDILFGTDRVWHFQRMADQYFTPIVGPDALETARTVADTGPPPAETGDGEMEELSSSQIMYDDNTRAFAYVNPYGYGWNNTAVTEAMAFEDLLTDPQYRGRLGIQDPETTPTLSAQWTLLIEKYPDILERVAAQEPRIYATGQPLAEAMVAGEVDVTIQASATGWAPYPTLDIAFEGVNLALPVYIEMMASAPHPNAAQVFANWLVSPEGQAVVSKDSVAFVPGTPGLEDNPTLADVEVYDSAQFTEEEHQATIAAFNEAMGR